HEVRLGHEVPRSPGNGRLSARRRARNLPKRAGADQRRTPRREAGPGRRARGAWGEPGRGRGVVRGGRRLAAMKIPRAPRFEVASITFTDRARDMVRSFLSDDGAASEALRISMSGNPAAPRFDLTLVSGAERSGDDIEIAGQDFPVLVDRAQADRLDGATVDYVDRLNESGFEVRLAQAPAP